MLHDITVFDFETTGVDFRTDQVVEMAAVRLIDGQALASFSALVRLRPKQFFHPKAREVTGLCPLHLVNAMKEEHAFKALRDLMRGSTVVSHNILFDYAFLHHGFMRVGLPAPAHDFLCTLTVCRNRRPGPHKLLDMVRAYGVEPRPAHRALDDVLMTVDLIRQLAEEGPLDGYVNRAGWNAWYEHPGWYPDHAKLVKQRPKTGQKTI